MFALTRQTTGLFVDCTSQQWVVRDPQGNFWLLPSGEWEARQPFEPTEEVELKPVPGHYLSMLDLPFPENMNQVNHER
jgi:hypothetical protein